MNRLAASQKSSRTMHNGLNMLAIAMPQGGDQFGVLLTSFGMEPLLELVQDQQHLVPGGRSDPCANAASESTSPSLGTVRDRPSETFEQPCSLSPPGSPRRKPARTCLPSRGSKPAFTSDDLPQPEGP